MKRKWKGLLLLVAMVLGSASVLAQASEESSSEAVLASTQAAVQETTKAAAAVAAVPIAESAPVAEATVVATEAAVTEYGIYVGHFNVDNGYSIYLGVEDLGLAAGVYTYSPALVEGYEYVGFYEIDGQRYYGNIATVDTSKAPEPWISVAFYYKKVDATTVATTTTAATTETSTTTASPEPTTTDEPATTVASTTSEPSTTVDPSVTTTVEPATTAASTTAEPVTTTATVATPATMTTEATTTTVSSNQKVTVSFDLAGGSLNGQTGTVSLEAELGQTITLPQAPTRGGYRFLYWKGSVYQAGAPYTVTGPKTFTAVWEPISSQTTENKQKTLPSTGETSSTLSFLGLAGLGFLALLGWSRKRKA